MKYLNRLISKILSYRTKKSWNYFVEILAICCIALCCFVVSLLTKQSFFDTIPEVIIAGIGIALAYAISKIGNTTFSLIEDKIKINHDYNKISQIYTDEYKQSINDEKAKFLFEYLQVNWNGKAKVTIDDNPKKWYEPNAYISSHLPQLYEGHKSTNFVNESLLRIDDYSLHGDNNITLSISRTTNLYGLCTNRSADVDVNGVTLRKLYEYQSHLKPLNESIMSNHLGVQCLVTIKHDGKVYGLFAKRQKDASISKFGIVDSIAERYQFRKNLDVQDNEPICSDDIVSFIESRLNEKFGISSDITKGINYLGFGREIYEMGRPQIFYCCEIDCDLDKINSLIKDHINNSKESYNRETQAYFIELDSICVDNQTNECSVIELTESKENVKKTYLSIEDSCLANIELYKAIKTKKNKKMFVFDIDGTLINNGSDEIEKEQKVSEELLNTLKMIRDNGDYVVIATGRTPYFVEQRLKSLANYGIYSNGALILDDHDNVIHQQKMNAFCINRLMEICKDMNLNMCFKGKNNYLAINGKDKLLSIEKEYNPEHASFVIDVNDNNIKDPIYSAFIYAVDDKDLEYLKNEFDKLGLSLFASFPGCYDAFNSSTNKGIAYNTLRLKKFDDNALTTYGFGDSNPDIPFLSEMDYAYTFDTNNQISTIEKLGKGNGNAIIDTINRVYGK